MKTIYLNTVLSDRYVHNDDIIEVPDEIADILFLDDIYNDEEENKLKLILMKQVETIEALHSHLYKTLGIAGFEY